MSGRAETAAQRAQRGLRIAIFAASAGCLAITAVCYLRPESLGGVSRALREAPLEAYLERWDRAVELAGTAAEEAELSNMSRELARVRKLDRLAPAVRAVELRLAGIAEERGDLERARAHARRLVQLDDRDLVGTALLGRLLASEPETRGEGLDLLRAACDRVPDSPLLVPPLCESLLADGRDAEAAEVVVRAAAQTASGVWHVQWSADRRDTAWFLPRAGADGGIEARFRVDGVVDGLRLRLPAYASMRLRDVRVRVEGPAGDEMLVLEGLEVELTSLRRDGSSLVAYGAVDPQLALPSVRAGRGATFTLTATADPVRPDFLGDYVEGAAGSRLQDAAAGRPELAAALAALRRGAPVR